MLKESAARAMPVDPKHSLIGRVIAEKFRLDALVGEGAMGAVYRGWHLSLEKPVAIKIMHAEHAATPSFSVRFKREAQAASRLDHPNSVRVIDFGVEPDGVLYLAMELLDGRDLYSMIEDDGRMPPGRIVSILTQVLGALATAHDAGVIHRDVKPENIMILERTNDDGAAIDVVKVCDFGIARLAESPEEQEAVRGRRLTGRGVAIGTPEYMSPEQALGEEIDARSDLYSVGVILFQLLTGRVPFAADTPMGVAFKHVSDEAPDILQLVPDANAELVGVCDRAMSKSRTERYQSAREMRSDLRRALGEVPSGSTPESALRPGNDWATEPASSLRRRKLFPASAPTMAEPGATVAIANPAPPPSSRGIWLLAVGALVLVGAAVFGVARRTPSAATLPTSTAQSSMTTPQTVTTASAPEIAEARPVVAPIASSETPLAITAPSPTTTSAKSPSSALVARNNLPSDPTAPPVAVASPPATTAVEPPRPPDPSPPPTIAAAPAPTPTDVAPAPPPPPAIDVSTARVAISGVSTTNALPSGNVRSAVARLDFVSCYRTALKAAGSAIGGTVSLHLAIDADGYVTSARAGGAGFLGAGSSCVEGRARGLRISNVDTGDASADITLVFTP